MESQPQNPEFKNNPEKFHPCIKLLQKKFVVKQILRSNYELLKNS